ncbi:hypothetical protein FXO38_26333 [Capsicum annuum]|nr:hypothetical protein FXO38_26333 [Capsicum annuum]
MARGNKRKAAEVRDEPEEIDPLKVRIDEEALILPHCARFVSAERYDLATVLDDVRSFSAKISVRSHLKMFNEFKQVVVDQRLKSRLKNSYFSGLWDLSEHMKFNGQLFHYTLLYRVEPDNKLHEIWFNINDRTACFGLKKFALISGLNYAKRLLKLIRGGRLDKEDTFKCCLVWFVYCILLARYLSKIVDIDTIKMVDSLGFFEKYPWGKESFSLTLDYLKKRIDFSRQKKTFETKGVSSYVLYGFSWAFMIWIYEAFPALGMGNGKSTEDPLPIPRLLRWHTSKGDKLIEVRKMKQHYTKKFKAFIDEPNDVFIDGLKACLEGMTVITLSEDGEDGDDDRDFGENAISKHVTQGAGTSKPRESRKTSMIKNLKERVFRLEESINDIADFVKEERLKRAEKERQKKRDEAEGVQVQSRHSATRAGCDDSSIKEALLEVASLEHASINTDKVMIPEVVAVVDKENLDEADEEKEEEKMKKLFMKKKTKLMDQLVWRRRIMKKADRMTMIKIKKSGCEEENNERDGQKTEEKNAQEVEKEQHKEERKSDAPEKEGIVKKDNENEFPNLDEFLNEVSQEIDKMMVETENVESLDNY